MKQTEKGLHSSEKSDHLAGNEEAGGAKKNRVFDDSIILDKGEYTVCFVTDGSHSFED